MSDAQQSDRPWRRDMFRLLFKPGIEEKFRKSHRGRYRYPRALLFLIAALGFGLAPTYQDLLWSPSAAVRPLLFTLEYLLVLPVMLVAMLATLSPGPRALVQGVQTVAVLVFWGAVVMLRYLALRGEIDYPAEMPGVAIVAVAVFGGFSCLRVIPTALLFSALAIGLEAHYGVSAGKAGLDIFSLGYLLLIAIGGAYVHELLARLAWSNGRRAVLSARTDTLTGLQTRAEFNRRLPVVLDQAAREGRMIGLALVDVDHFKRINDSCGHLFGDQVLGAIGAVLRRSTQRPLDLHARFGGEEFVLLWHDITPPEFHRQIDRLLASIRELEVIDPRQQQAVPLSVSVGGVWLVPRPGIAAEALLQEADQRLYEAKAAGRDQAKLHAAGVWATAGSGRPGPATAGLLQVR